jgi:hypothetical protein
VGSRRVAGELQATRALAQVDATASSQRFETGCVRWGDQIGLWGSHLQQLDGERCRVVQSAVREVHTQELRGVALGAVERRD